MVDGSMLASSATSSLRTSTFVPSARISTTRSPSDAIGLRSGAPPWTPHQRASSPLELPGNAVSWRSMTAPIASSLGSGILATQPGARVDEGHVPAVVGAEAQEAAAGGGLQERTPARRHAVGERLVAEPLRQGLAEGGAGHRRVGQHVADPVLEGEHLLPGDLEVPEPQRPQPVDPRPERRDQLRQLVRGDQVERPAHGPGLDQRAVAPQGVPHVVAGHALDAGMDRELGRADDLRLHRDVVADDVEHRLARRALLEVLPPQPERGDLRPGGLDHARQRTGAVRQDPTGTWPVSRRPHHGSMDDVRGDAALPPCWGRG